MVAVVVVVAVAVAVAVVVVVVVGVVVGVVVVVVVVVAVGVAVAVAVVVVVAVAVGMSAGYDRLIAAGYPTAWLEIPGLLPRSSCAVLGVNLDGTVWVHTINGAPVNIAYPDGVAQIMATGTNPTHPAWNAPNPYRLTTAQIRVLAEFADAGVTGLADHEHRNTPPSTIADHRGHLARHGLIAVRPGGARTTRGGTAHVWNITQAGRHTLCQPCPTLTPTPASVSA